LKAGAAYAAVPLSQIALVAILALAIPLSGWGALYPRNTWLQLGPCVVAVLVAVPLLRRYPVSTASVRNIVLFLLLHCIAARWSYSFVPYDAWAQYAVGWSPGAAFGFSRNMFDRLVHLCFGLLAIGPVREIAVRHFGVPSRLAFYIAPEFVVAFSAAYEIFEWQLALAMDPADAEAYNGQRGDLFDAQKDMALAAMGALIATGLHWLHDRRGRR
jgi:putative membrane protein